MARILTHLTLPVVKLSQRPNGGQILRRLANHLFQVSAGLVQLALFDESAAQSDAGRQIRGVTFKTRATRLDRLVETAGATVLLGECRKNDRRRVDLDPALEFIDAAGSIGRRLPTHPSRIP